jgi:hypothetical protein
MTFQCITRIGLLHVAVILLAGDVSSGSAQSLGDVARREAERRQQVTSGKVYTDGDLGPVDPATAPAPPTAQPPASGGERQATPPTSSPASAETPTGKEPVILKGREQRDEQYWRKLMPELRARVARANAEVAAQEARLVEIDGGEQTPTRLQERQVVLSTLSRAQRDARSLTEELTRFMTRAQMAKVPDEWIR